METLIHVDYLLVQVWHAILIHLGIAIHVCKAIMTIVVCNILLKRLGRSRTKVKQFFCMD